MSAEISATNTPAVVSTVEEPTTTTAAAAVEAPVESVAADATITTNNETSEVVQETPAVETSTEENKPAVVEPTTSKSNTTGKRISVLLGKAKNFVDKKVTSSSEKKPVTPTKEPEASVELEAPVEELKSEKRKSILGNIFRSKSPVPAATSSKEVQKSEEPSASKEESKSEEPAVDKEKIQETSATTSSGAATTEEPNEPTTTAAAQKDYNVIDTLKKGPLGKFFNKKKETEQPKEENTVAVEPVTVPVAPKEEEPVAAEPTTTTSEPEETKRSGSPLGRRITQMFRGFSHKKKKEEGTSVAVTEEAPEEEEPVAVAATAVPVAAPVVPTTPAVQATA
ncbi:MAG: hypothetical protein EXX96DRAFT_622737 [Benjaminiella poitrasii]|nr:MAG: hypothetical protein EXX96DRAFT_622737 [Benjaminiella poitrasii]